MPSPGRLTAPEDFRLVYREGSRISDELFTIYVRPAADTVLNIGIAVPGRFGMAVRRNRLRRRVREALQRCARQLPRGAEVIVVPRSAAEAAPFRQLQESLCVLFNRGAVSPWRGGGSSQAT